MNLMMLLEMAASGMGDRVAVVNGDDRLTYGELFQAAGVAAATAVETGAEHIATLDVSSLAVPVGLFAGAWAGLPFVPLNYRLTGDELETLVDQIAPSYLVTDAERVGKLAHIRRTTLVERDAFLAGARAGEAGGSDWSMDGDDIAILLFTSGTTGPPKAAVIRHKHIVSYILGSVEFMSAGEEDASLMCVPPYHIAAMAAISSSIYAGRRIVQLANFTAEAWIELARAERITNAFVVPTMLARIVDALDDGGAGKLPHLRNISYGGGKMPQSVIERAMELFPDANFTNAYGLTETSSTISILGPDDHREAMASEDPKIRRRLISLGRPLPSVEVEIRTDEGGAAGPDERGEIYVRGEQVSGEYLGRGSRLDDSGWFPTRDGGCMDADGYLFLEGRIDDIIVRGGENISPGEVEDVLLTHPAIADAAVVGVRSEQWGEDVAAAVVTKAGQTVSGEELYAFVKQQLRSSRAPERVEFCDELPYNETGKLLRRKVRSEIMGEGS